MTTLRTIVAAKILAAAAVLLATALAGRLARAAGEGQLALTVVDEKTQQPVPCRMHLVGPGKRPRKVENVPYWSDHFVFPGQITLKLPVGNYSFEVRRGPEYRTLDGYFTINQFADDSKKIDLRRFVDMSAEGWWSGDLYVRRSVRDAELLMAADDLHVAQIVTWWNDKNDAVSRAMPKKLVTRFDGNRCYESPCGGYARAGTEALCFHLLAPLLGPRGNSEYPSIVQQLLRAREKADLWVDLASTTGWDLPLLIAHGQVDSIEVANSHLCRKSILADEAPGRPRDLRVYPGPFGYARWSQETYYKLLDCGLRIPPTAGSGSGVSPNPAGYNRVYVHLDGEFDYSQWWKNLRAGQVVVTNGPIMRPMVEGQLPGYVFQGEEGKDLELEIGLTLAVAEPISYLDIIQDGRLRESIRFEDYAKSGRLPKLHFKRSGWFLLRAVTDLPETYRFAMTGPYYVEMGGQRRVSKQAAQFFLDWVYQRARQIALDDPDQRREVLEYHRKARDFWREIVARANAE